MYTLNALARELFDSLVGGRIEKINQPEKDEVTFYVHAGGKNKILVVSVNPNSPRIHITTEKKDNPYIAPPFLMHLRKRFIGAKIESVACVGYDRVIEFKLKGRNEMSDETKNLIYVELMGRYSNVIVCEDDGIISEALRHITPENSLRCIMPKVKYELPPNEKRPPDKDAESVLKGFTGGDVAKFLTSNFAGFSFATASEAVYRAGLNEVENSLDESQISRLADVLRKFYTVNDTDIYAPSVRFEKGSATDFYFAPYFSSGYEFTRVESLNEAVRLCSVEKDRVARLQNEGKALNAAVKNALKKCERNLGAARQKLIDCESMDETRIAGELVINNIYLLKKGDSELTTVNYYDGKEITIPLDPLLTPQQNAQNFFKKYKKMERTVAICEKQALELTSTIDYLNSIKTALDLAENTEELVEIKEELIAAGLIKEKQQKGKVRKPKQLPPKEYVYNGFTVLRGRNNIENERVTFHLGADNDLWLHVKDSHGSHLIIKSEGKKIPDDVIKFASEIAAFYSEKSQSGNTVVDYALRKFVKKRPGGAKGAVIYTDYKSAVVTPNAHKECERN